MRSWEKTSPRSRGQRADLSTSPGQNPRSSPSRDRPTTTCSLVPPSILARSNESGSFPTDRILPAFPRYSRDRQRRRTSPRPPIETVKLPTDGVAVFTSIPPSARRSPRNAEGFSVSSVALRGVGGGSVAPGAQISKARRQNLANYEADFPL